MRNWIRIVAFMGIFLTTALAAEEAFYEAVPVTPINSFTSGIEGPACDREGKLFVVNFERQGTIGRVGLYGNAEVHLSLPENGVGNAIRFGRDGTMFIADYINHRILKVAPASTEITVHVDEPLMHQPNDLTITTDGTIYASDPDWEHGAGRIWRISVDGRCEIVAKDLKLPNGIEIAPDGRHLYVALTEAAEVIVFDVDQSGQLSNQKSFVRFSENLVDGIRCDITGNLYVARYGAAAVAIVSVDGERVRDVNVLGNEPSNLCFGGADGRTVFVTEVQNRRVVKFTVPQPGATWASHQ